MNPWPILGRKPEASFEYLQAEGSALIGSIKLVIKHSDGVDSGEVYHNESNWAGFPF